MEKSRFQLQKHTVIVIMLIIYDIVVVNLAYGLALWIRFDLHFTDIPDRFWYGWVDVIPFYTVLAILTFVVLKLYHSVWRYVSYNEIFRAAVATGITLVFQILISCIFFTRMPISYYAAGALLQFMFVAGGRFSYRGLRIISDYFTGNHKSKVKRVMVIGAGDAGRMILRELKVERPVTSKVVCLVDDNPDKSGRMLDNVEIKGNRDDIPELAERYNIDRIIFAIPGANNRDRKEILDICKTTGCELKMLPSLSQFINDKGATAQLQNVSVEELLGRDTIKINNDEIRNTLQDKVVMVTGGGGSIGSELARQIAANDPRQLILFEIYENNVYDIQQWLKWHYPQLDLKCLIGSVRDEDRLRDVMEEYRPDIVFHAAAHKHVPLMEDSPNEAIKNNVAGTYKTAMVASECGVSKFVLISTDKAVNPTNIMGASKRMCEMVIQMINRKSETDFVAVRFGNVLGSNGSVIPLFKKQIAAGGPVTVTHPDITRFFMTIPEAVSLVLQAGSYAENGEIFVLDMGKPVKIDELARNLIYLSGHTPDVDIKIIYTGLRPGEKLYEELLMDNDNLVKTANDLIFVEKLSDWNPEEFETKLKVLFAHAEDNQDGEKTKDMVADIVETYKRENK